MGADNDDAPAIRPDAFRRLRIFGVRRMSVEHVGAGDTNQVGTQLLTNVFYVGGIHSHFLLFKHRIANRRDRFFGLASSINNFARISNNYLDIRLATEEIVREVSSVSAYGTLLRDQPYLTPLRAKAYL
tara:strand:+ start:1012 stop:1398 length:387 start_codon:yes stop_codon:yes gene_type:complete